MPIFFCKSCGRRFCEKRAKIRDLSPQTVETYLFDTTSLKSVLNTKNPGLSTTTLYRRIREAGRLCPNWDDLLRSGERQARWGSVMGIDTSGLKIKGRDHIYVHVADVTSRDPLAYLITEKEDSATIEPILRRLKNSGYTPRIVVTDLAPELLKSIERIYLCAKIQGCVFHLVSRLKKKLLTRKILKEVGRDKAKLYSTVVDYIFHAATAKNSDVRSKFLDRLKRLDLDEKARDVVEGFLADLRFYHTLDEEEFKGLGPNVLYNNVCERQIQSIKNLKKKMIGFKSRESASGIIKLFWFHKRKGLTSSPEKAECVPENERASEYSLSMPYFFDPVNLAVSSDVSGVPIRILTETAQKMGRVIVGDFAFTEAKLNEIRKGILKTREKTVIGIANEINFGQQTVLKLLNRFGFKVLVKSLDPSDWIVSFGGPE